MELIELIELMELMELMELNIQSHRQIHLIRPRQNLACIAKCWRFGGQSAFPNPCDPQSPDHLASSALISRIAAIGTAAVTCISFWTC